MLTRFRVFPPLRQTRWDNFDLEGWKGRKVQSRQNDNILSGPVTGGQFSLKFQYNSQQLRGKTQWVVPSSFESEGSQRVDKFDN